MIAVSDTSPLNYLVLLEHIDLLPLLFTKVVVTDAVRAELLHPGAPVKVRTWAAAPPLWVRLSRPEIIPSPAIPGLQVGETEAIALAQELRADRLLIDEAAGRAAAIQRGLYTAGTLSILRDAHRLNMLDLPSTLIPLQAAGFRMSSALQQELLESI